MPGQTLDILALTSAEFAAAAATRGAARPEAMAIYRAAFREGVVGRSWVWWPEEPVGRVEREGGTTKFTLAAGDGLETESVILPQRSRAGRTRNALCLSSQIGCAMGCTFCETGRMGLMKNLDAGRIVGQWRAARFALGTRVSNVVFMGMGEPMDNIEAVIRAIRVLADHNGPSIPASRIAVSTVGRIDGIARLGALAREPGFRQLRLAVSLNAPNDEVRRSIMPINRSAPMGALMEAMRRWPSSNRLRILIEYVLIPGVNDAPEHADELCAYLAPLACTVNVIPYNPIPGAPWPAPGEADVEAFIARVRAGGRLVKRRRTMGRSVMGACGQLGNPGVRRRKLFVPSAI